MLLGDIERTKALAMSEDPYILKWGDGAEKPSGATVFSFAENDLAANGRYVLENDDTGLKVSIRFGFTISVR